MNNNSKYNDLIQKLDVIILVGGLGSRLKKITKETPKPLVLINNRPFLSILLNYISSFGFRRIILCACYKADFIKSFINKYSFQKMDIELSIEDTALGTAGAVKNAQRLIKSKDFIVLNGDTFFQLDYFEYVKYYYLKNGSALISLSQTSKLKNYGNIELDNHKQIIKFNEKKTKNFKSHFFNSGVYLLNEKILNYIPQYSKSSFEYDIFPYIINNEKLKILGYISKGAFIDIGTPEDYYRAQHFNFS